LFDSTLGNKSRTKKWKVEEKRDLEEATVGEEAVMEEEAEEAVTVEGAEVEGEDMAVEEAAVAMDREADTAAKAAVEASNEIGAQCLWKRARKLMSRLIQSVGEATGSPASTTL
jgi:hypothetical protein